MIAKDVAAGSGDATKDGLPLTKTALHALVLCHERYLQQVSEGIVSSLNSSRTAAEDEDGLALAYVREEDVAAGVESAGFSHILPEASAAAKQEKQASRKEQIENGKKKIKHRRRRTKARFTEEEMELQESLLAKSKEKATAPEEEDEDAAAT